jgi:hypothetical protein
MRARGEAEEPGQGRQTPILVRDEDGVVVELERHRERARIGADGDDRYDGKPAELTPRLVRGRRWR